jgi:hypothetical protein
MVIAAGFADAVRALGSAGLAVMYAFALTAVVLVVWLFGFAG